MDQWKVVRHQLRWASSVFTTYAGVCDWGFDAAVQNSAYAYGALREPSTATWHKDRYAQLHDVQRNVRGMMTHPYFPPVHRNGSWRWAQDLSSVDDLSVGAGPLADDWLGIDGNGQPVPFAAMYTLSMQTQQHWWHNLLSGFNSAIAYLLLTDVPFLEPL